MNAQKPDVARAYSILARWRDLAEKRLDHHIELYQTGRWQRYYSETEFLTMIRELVNAVEAWRQLAPRESAKPSAQTQQLAAFNVWKDLGGGDVSLAPSLPQASAMTQAPVVQEAAARQ